MEVNKHHISIARNGEIAEARFDYDISCLGGVVFEPKGHNHPYDRVVDFGQGLKTVQVKSTFDIHKQNYFKVNLTTGGTSLEKFKNRVNWEVDFISCYIISEKVWYHIPSHLVDTKITALYFNPHKPDNKDRYRAYLNNWEVFRKS